MLRDLACTSEAIVANMVPIIAGAELKHAMMTGQLQILKKRERSVRACPDANQKCDLSQLRRDIRKTEGDILNARRIVTDAYKCREECIEARLWLIHMKFHIERQARVFGITTVVYEFVLSHSSWDDSVASAILTILCQYRAGSFSKEQAADAIRQKGDLKETTINTLFIAFDRPVVEEPCEFVELQEARCKLVQSSRAMVEASQHLRVRRVLQAWLHRARQGMVDVHIGKSVDAGDSRKEKGNYKKSKEQCGRALYTYDVALMNTICSLVERRGLSVSAGAQIDAVPLWSAVSIDPSLVYTAYLALLMQQCARFGDAEFKLLEVSVQEQDLAYNMRFTVRTERKKDYWLFFVGASDAQAQMDKMAAKVSGRAPQWMSWIPKLATIILEVDPLALNALGRIATGNLEEEMAIKKLTMAHAFLLWRGKTFPHAALQEGAILNEELWPEEGVAEQHNNVTQEMHVAGSSEEDIAYLKAMLNEMEKNREGLRCIEKQQRIPFQLLEQTLRAMRWSLQSLWELIERLQNLSSPSNPCKADGLAKLDREYAKMFKGLKGAAKTMMSHMQKGNKQPLSALQIQEKHHAACVQRLSQCESALLASWDAWMRLGLLSGPCKDLPVRWWLPGVAELWMHYRRAHREYHEALAIYEQMTMKLLRERHAIEFEQLTARLRSGALNVAALMAFYRSARDRAVRVHQSTARELMVLAQFFVSAIIDQDIKGDDKVRRIVGLHGSPASNVVVIVESEHARYIHFKYLHELENNMRYELLPH